MKESVGLNPTLSSLIHPVHGMVGEGPGELGLDAWAYDNGGFVPDFVKLDIEGEVSALHSAESILADRHPSLIVEVHSRHLEREAGELLVRHGYRPLVVSHRKVFRDRRPA